MRVTWSAFVMMLVFSASLPAACGDTHVEYSLLNATHHRIWVIMLRGSRNGKEWENLPLRPSQSAGFAGDLTYVKVRLPPGRLFEYHKRQIAGVRARAGVRQGDWLFNASGLHFISCKARQSLFEALNKYEWRDKI